MARLLSSAFYRGALLGEQPADCPMPIIHGWDAGVVADELRTGMQRMADDPDEDGLQRDLAQLAAARPLIGKPAAVMACAAWQEAARAVLA